MGWGAVWQLALTQFNAEPVEMRIAILVAGAFCVLMILIGLKYAFRVAEPAPAVSELLPAPPKRAAVLPLVPVAAQVEAVAPAKPVAPAPFRVTRKPAAGLRVVHTKCRLTSARQADRSATAFRVLPPKV